MSFVLACDKTEGEEEIKGGVATLLSTVRFKLNA